VASGAAGNVAADQITAPVSIPTGITKVTNLGPGQNGSDEEPIDATLRRAPEDIKIRYRAVTADDYEFLAREARNDIAISSCLSPRAQIANGPGNPPAWQKGDPWSYAGILRAPGTVSLVIVPNQGLSVIQPGPTREQLGEVQAYLDARRDLTARLQVLGPRYLPIIAQVDFVVWQQALDAGADPAAIREDIRQKVVGFLHPVHGGSDGTGWRLGQSVFTANLFQAITLPADIGYISGLQIKPDIPAYHFPPLNPKGTATNFNQPMERPFPLSALGPVARVADYELVCSADPAAHTITPIPPPPV
jgi:predicted phage baseplate assembly protein